MSKTKREASESSSTANGTIVPFLKWAGGKRWLIRHYAPLLNVSFERYVEPFLGSAAVYFHLHPKQALLADLNQNLIDCYIAVREQWEYVLRILKRHQRCHSNEYYYEERHRKRRSLAERAAQLIYLNRTCWNGLYRVNLKGEFNVPIGTKNSIILDTDKFKAISEMLKN